MAMRRCAWLLLWVAPKWGLWRGPNLPPKNLAAARPRAARQPNAYGPPAPALPSADDAHRAVGVGVEGEAPALRQVLSHPVRHQARLVAHHLRKRHHQLWSRHLAPRNQRPSAKARRGPCRVHAHPVHAPSTQHPAPTFLKKLTWRLSRVRFHRCAPVVGLAGMNAVVELGRQTSVPGCSAIAGASSANTIASATTRAGMAAGRPSPAVVRVTLCDVIEPTAPFPPCANPFPFPSDLDDLGDLDFPATHSFDGLPHRSMLPPPGPARAVG
jgi:hypothetical protein